MAVAHANQVLSWEENLSADEMPPEWMWPLWWEIKDHMNQVIAGREAKLNRGGPDGPVTEGETWVAKQSDINDWLNEGLQHADG